MSNPTTITVEPMGEQYPGEYSVRTSVTERNYVGEDEMYDVLAWVCEMDRRYLSRLRTGESWVPAKQEKRKS